MLSIELSTDIVDNNSYHFARNWFSLSITLLVEFQTMKTGLPNRIQLEETWLKELESEFLKSYMHELKLFLKSEVLLIHSFPEILSFSIIEKYC